MSLRCDQCPHIFKITKPRGQIHLWTGLSHLPARSKDLLAHVGVLLVKRELRAGHQLLLALTGRDTLPWWHSLVLGHQLTEGRTRGRWGGCGGLTLGLAKGLAAQPKLLFTRESLLPEGEGGFVHLHAHQEGILGKLDGGDKVERRLGFKADLHTRSHEVHVHCNISGDH